MSSIDERANCEETDVQNGSSNDAATVSASSDHLPLELLSDPSLLKKFEEVSQREPCRWYPHAKYC